MVVEEEGAVVGAVVAEEVEEVVEEVVEEEVVEAEQPLLDEEPTQTPNC